jgi:hypothetical protein
MQSRTKAFAAGLSLLIASVVVWEAPRFALAQSAPQAAPAGRGRGGRGAQGLPDGRDKLFIPEADYVRFPLPPGEEQYASIQGTDLKKITADIVAISEKSRAAGNLYYGRITGTPYDKATSDYVQAAFRKLGLEDTREQEFSLSPQWFPTSWKVELSAGGKTIPLTSAFPFQNGRGTAQGPIEAEAVWVGLGTAADFKGRDVKGKAVFIYSFPTPGGRDHTALTNGMVQRATDAGAALVFVVLGFPGNAQAIASVAPPPIPAMSLGVNDGNAVREAIERGDSARIRLSLDVKMVPGLKTYNTWGVLPGATDENILVMAHHDGFFDAALDNASGTALMLEIAILCRCSEKPAASHADVPGHVRPSCVARSGGHLGSRERARHAYEDRADRQLRAHVADAVLFSGQRPYDGQHHGCAAMVRGRERRVEEPGEEQFSRVRSAALYGSGEQPGRRAFTAWEHRAQFSHHRPCFVPHQPGHAGMDAGVGDGGSGTGLHEDHRRRE